MFVGGLGEKRRIVGRRRAVDGVRDRRKAVSVTRGRVGDNGRGRVQTATVIGLVGVARRLATGKDGTAFG